MLNDRVPSAWSTFKQALRGDVHEDFTQGDLRRGIVLLAIPMVAEMIMESIFALVDIAVVSRLGAEAVAAVGITESMMAIVYAMAIGLCMAAGAVVARRTGEKDPEGAARAAAQTLFLGVAFSTVVAVAGAIFAPDLLRLMGASDAVVEKGAGFTRVMLGGNASVFLIFLINAVFRGAGDATIAMRTLWLANALNIVLCPCFVFGLGPFPEMGVTGAAVATCIGRGIGVVYQIGHLLGGRRRLTLRARHLRIEPKLLASMLRIGFTGFVQFIIGSASWIGLMRLMATFGEHAVAGYTVAMRMIMFAILPAWGLSNAAATLVGQNLGAGKPERSEAAVWLGARYALYFLSVVGILFIALGGVLVDAFAGKPEVVEVGTRALRIMALGFPLYAYGLVMTSSFNGAGDTWTPTIINLFCFWLWEIPLAYVLADGFDQGPRGVFIAITIAFSTMAVVGVLVFRRGKWKLKKV